MNTKFWKNIISSFFVVLFSFRHGFADDVRLKIPVSSINNAFSAITESKYLSYGTVNDGGFVTYYSLKPKSVSFFVSPGRTFSMTLVVDAVANFNLEIFDFDLPLNDQSMTVTGEVSLQEQGAGWKVMFVPQSIIYDGEAWLESAINVAATGLVSKLPEISTSSSQPLLPEVARQYFTSGTPALTTTSTEIILGFTLIPGSRSVTAYNDVNQRRDIGFIDEVNISTGGVLSTGSSPRTFEWNTGTMHQMQTPQSLLASTNGQNKYKNWFSSRTGIQTDIAPRRIQLTVGTNDEEFAGDFDQAQHVQLSNLLLDANTGGGTVTYEYSPGVTTTAATFDDYDYNYSNYPFAHPINTTVPNGTLGLNWLFSEWSDGNMSQSRSIVLNTDVNLIAKYKTSLATNTFSAFSVPGERKLLRSNDGTLHLMYESGQQVWYENSTDGGATWNNLLKVSSSDGKYPAACLVGGSNFLVAFQESGAGNANIRINYYESFGGEGIPDRLASTVFSTSVPNTSQLNPAIACTDDGILLVVYQENGISYRFFSVSPASIDSYDDPNGSGGLPSTDNNSRTPAAAAIINDADPNNIRHYLDVVYEQRGTSSSAVWYKRFEIFPTGNINPQPATNLSSGSSYTYNYSPSVIFLNDGIARLNWVGRRLNQYDPDIMESASIFRGADYYYFWSFGNFVGSSQINRSDAGYLMAWTEGTSIYTKDNTILNGGMNSVSGVSGSTVQVSEGLAGNDFKVAALNGSSPPYRFYVGSAHYGLPKAQATAIGTGRSGVIAQGNAEFYFVLGDITVDNQRIDFVDFPDTMQFPTAGDVNKVLVTEPFTLSSSSIFTYGVQYGVRDSVSAVSVLSPSNSVSFKVQLLDASTDEIIGSYDEILMNSSNPTQYERLAYQVNTDGMVSRSVKLRLVVAQTGLSPIYSVTCRQAEESILGKSGTQRKTISYKGKEVVTTYALAQNYPNPFNPSTTIDYQIPKPGRVLLHIYDVLGREVATLVNEYKTEGRYSATFDASNLSSGVYFYRLRSGKFTEIKKLQVLK